MQMTFIRAAVWLAPVAGAGLAAGATLSSSAGAAGLIGLLSAVLWGGGDFCGGMGTRRMSALRVVLTSHTASVTALLLLAWMTHAPLPGQTAFLWGVVAGVAGGAALMSFYTALSLGDMGSSAALSGLIAAAIPVVFALRTEGFPGWMKMAGFALAGAAIWLVAGTSAGQDRHPTQKRAFALALFAGVGFGVFLAAIKLAGNGGVFWALASARVGSLGFTLLAMLVVAVRSAASRSVPASQATGEHQAAVRFDGPGVRRLGATWPGATWPGVTWPGVTWLGVTWPGVRWALTAALLDTSGNLMFIVATRVGRLDVAAVLGSLYPASTMLLAAWMLHERPTRRQAFGMAVALAAVLVITL